MKILLLLIFLLCSARAPIPDDIVPIHPFGNTVMQYIAKEYTRSAIGQARLGCYFLFCHIDDASSCVLDKKLKVCECRDRCMDFSKIHTPKPKKESPSVWKNKEECANECLLLVSNQKNNADSVCTSLCAIHFSYPNWEEYQKNYIEIFSKIMKDSPFPCSSSHTLYQEAQEYCASRHNGTLPILENDDVHGRVKDFGAIVWVGIVCDGGSSSWTWQTGEYVNFVELGEEIPSYCVNPLEWFALDNGTLVHRTEPVGNILCFTRPSNLRIVDESSITLWIIVSVVVSILVLAVAITLFKFRERLCGYSEEELTLIHLIEAIAFPPETPTSAEISIKARDGRYVSAKPAENYLWGVELTTHRGDRARWILEPSKSRNGKATIRSASEPHKYMNGSSNGTVLLPDRECMGERWDISISADGTYAIRSWTGNYMSSEDQRVTTDRRKDTFIMEFWDTRSTAKPRVFRRFFPLRLLRIRKSAK